MRSFRTQTTRVWDKLDNEEEIVITNNGQPRAFLVSIPDGAFDEMLTGIRHAKSQILPRIERQRYAKKRSQDEMTSAMQEIRELLSDIDGDSIDIEQIRAERRTAKYEHND